MWFFIAKDHIFNNTYYFCYTGVSKQNDNLHASKMCAMAIEFMRKNEQMAFADNHNWFKPRIGIHTGTCFSYHINLYICLSACLSVCLLSFFLCFFFLSFYLPTCLSVCLSIYLYIYLSINIYIYIYIPTYLPIYLSIYRDLTCTFRARCYSARL